METKLAAILCADMHGYSRLMGEDEEATLCAFTSHRNIVRDRNAGVLSATIVLSH